MTTTSKQQQFITINIGNTNLSIAHNQDKKLFSALLSANDANHYQLIIRHLTNWLSQTDKIKLLICSVIHNEDFSVRYPEIFSLVEAFKKKSPQSYLEYKNHLLNDSFLNMKINYAKTLGWDRLIQSYKLWNILKAENLQSGLIIDAGTMTTLDIVSTEQGHLGGYILPGLNSYAGIFQVSKQLPTKNDLVLSLKNSQHTCIPINTLDAITYGYWQSFLSLIKEIHNNYKLQKIIISGGDGEFWSKNLTQNKAFSAISTELNLLFPHQSLWQIGADVLT